MSSQEIILQAEVSLLLLDDPLLAGVEGTLHDLEVDVSPVTVLGPGLCCEQDLLPVLSGGGQGELLC